MPRKDFFDEEDREEYEEDARLIRRMAKTNPYIRKHKNLLLKGFRQQAMVGRPDVFFDNVHGPIRLTPLEQELEQQPLMRRLQHVSQLTNPLTMYGHGMSQNRLCHSMGAMHIAGRIARRLGLSRKQEQEIRAAALLHDVGHFTFSHSAQDLMRKQFGYDHEEAGDRRLRESEVPGILKRHGLDMEEVIRLSHGEGLGEIISEWADRIDYLMRDTRFSGMGERKVKEVNAMLNRLADGLALRDGKICVKASAAKAADQYAKHRTLMYNETYLHPTVIITQDILQRAIARSLREGHVTEKDLLGSTDHEVFTKLKGPEAEVLQNHPDAYYKRIALAVNFADLNRKGMEFVRHPDFKRRVAHRLRGHLKPIQYSIGVTPRFEKDFHYRVLHPNGRTEERTASHKAPDKNKFAFVVMDKENPAAEAALHRYMAPYIKTGAELHRNIWVPLNPTQFPEVKYPHITL